MVKRTPWDFPDLIKAPQSPRFVQYDHAQEFRMNSPLGAKITLLPEGISFARDKHFYRFFGGPAVWSDDGHYVAIPEWEPLWNRQRLCVFDFKENQQGVSPVEFSVIQVESISNDAVRLTNSPVFQPKDAIVAFEKLIWVNLKDYPDFVFTDGRTLSFEKLAAHRQKKS